MKPYIFLLFLLIFVGGIFKTQTLDVFRMSIEEENKLYERHINDARGRDTKVGAVSFAFAKHFQDHMVLQKAPQKANIYGFSPSIGQRVTLQLDTVPATHAYNYQTTVQQSSVSGVGVWNFVLDPFAPGVSVTIKVESNGVSHTITDVLFGDVWICSGQSNMQMTVSMIDGGSQEIADAHNYPNIRLMTVNMDESPIPLLDLIKIEQNWARADRDSVGHWDWSYFSAVCWLFGKEIYKARNYPIGLIASDWGGTAIRTWSSPQAVATCGPTEEQQHGDHHYKEYLKKVTPHLSDIPQNNSACWNSMIYPLLGTTIYGAIWYQGESDAWGVYMDKYKCTFPTMIKDWRANFNRASNGQTSASFPFGFVQLAPYKPNGPTVGFTDIRWHQTADKGYVPNPDMVNVFMAVSIDLPDFNSTYDPVHPRYKKDIGSRLALSGLAVAYQQSGIFQGPLPTGSHKTSSGLVVDYGNTWQLDVRVSDGFELQCSSPQTWVATTIISHTTTTVTLNSGVCNSGAKITGLRYAWSESPCALHKCAIYETSKSLPGPPFVSYADFDAFGNPYFTFDRP